MAITLNGTTGITTPDVTSDSYTGALAVNASAPDNSLVVNASGNVGVGTSSPTAKLEVVSTGSASTYTVSGIVRDNTYPNSGYATLEFNGWIGGNGYRSAIGTIGGQQLAFYTPSSYGVAPTERARIDASGNLLVGRTSRVNAEKVGIYFVGTTHNGLTLSDTQASGDFARFFASTSTQVGSISHTSSSTSYNTTSDYRLKENVVPLAGAADRLAQIPVHRFNFTADPDTTVDGFLAHEVQAFVPEAVTGEKDAVETVEIKDEEGNVTGQEERPVYQGIDQSKLVPLLTAALQEALAEIETLKARVSALEAA